MRLACVVHPLSSTLPATSHPDQPHSFLAPLQHPHYAIQSRSSRRHPQKAHGTHYGTTIPYDSYRASSEAKRSPAARLTVLSSARQKECEMPPLHRQQATKAGPWWSAGLFTLSSTSTWNSSEHSGLQAAPRAILFATTWTEGPPPRHKASAASCEL